MVDRVQDAELLRLTSRRSAPVPVIEQRPGRYLGYFENKFGEQLVFVHEDGEPDAVVFCGDVDWGAHRVTDAGGLPDVGDVILGREEWAFLVACWIATAWRREGARSRRVAA
jgi:hypothetical protein